MIQTGGSSEQVLEQLQKKPSSGALDQTLAGPAEPGPTEPGPAESGPAEWN